MSQTHELKTWPAYFDAVKRGEKTFEVRRDDRGFQKGDKLKLVRFDPKVSAVLQPWSEPIEKTITYVLTGGQFGIEPGFVVLGLGDAS
jgi:hypothetical protein